MVTRSPGRSLASLAVLAALALAPVPALARDGADSDFAGQLNDPRKQEAMGKAMGAVMTALLDIKAEPLARAMEQMGDPSAARRIPHGATLGDLAGPEARRMPGEVRRRVPMMMGAMSALAGMMQELAPGSGQSAKISNARWTRAPAPTKRGWVTKHPRRAVIDIGSNTIRLVVYGGPPRAPVALFNEKVVAGLGRGVVATGRIDAESMAAALSSLARFAALTRLMEPVKLRVAATAAVRDAANGAEFLAQVRELGLAAELLSGEEEANAAGFGVISTNPAAAGLVADLGGGSLELVRISGAAVHQRVSLPLGAMRVAAIRAGGRGQLRRVVGELASRQDWLSEVRGQRLTLVGGAWRALARVHMEQVGWPLAVLDNYSFPAADARGLKLHVRSLGLAQLIAIPGVKSARAAQLDDAAALLAALASVIEPAQITVSGAGLREGLLFQALTATERRKDPLIEGLRHALGGQQPRSGQDEALLAWSDGAFPGEPTSERRLRHAACLIAGTSWASNPEFRTLAAEDLALHGNWLGLSHGDRAVIAMALHIGLGGDPGSPPPLLARLAEPERLERAHHWGLALRLAQRIGAGAVLAVEALPLELASDGALVLRLPRRAAALADAGVERRHGRLAAALGREARIES